MGSEDELEIEGGGDHEAKVEKSDSDSDFEVSGKGRKKRQSKVSNKRRKTDCPAVPKIPRCRQCRQRTDDNPNLVKETFLTVPFEIWLRLEPLTAFAGP